MARLSLRPFSVRDLLGRNGKKVVDLYPYYSLLSFAGSGAGSLRGNASDCLRWLSVVLKADKEKHALATRYTVAGSVRRAHSAARAGCLPPERCPCSVGSLAYKVLGR